VDALARAVTVEVTGLPAGEYTVSSARVDERHANIAHVWREIGGGDWPDEAQWTALRAADTLPIEYLAKVAVGADGVASVAIDLPMPGIRSLRLTRQD
jgi:xylan 1,4-beta-xylosidase